MIRNHTVLVLGAGASYPYGFPLGAELQRYISGELGPNGWIRPALLRAGARQDEIDAFLNAFVRSRMYSIDSFLARRPEFSFVGKAAIACIIKSKEDLSRFVVPTRGEKEYDGRDDWYRYLWSNLCDSWEDFNANRLSIVNFNYDQSLKHYLLEAMSHTFGKAEDQCREKLEAIPIEHIYGAVEGKYGTPGPDPENLLTYFDGMRLQAAVKSIEIMPEGRNDSERLKRCRELLASADRICFLGFSFDPLNLERLSSDSTCTDMVVIRGEQRLRQVVGTALGLEPLEAYVAARMCGLTNLSGDEDGYPAQFLPLMNENLLRRKQLFSNLL